MTRKIVGFAAAALFTLSLSTAWAQDSRPGQDSGPSGPPGGPAGGGGNPAGAGGGSSATSSDSGGGSSSVSSGGSGGGGSTSSIGGSSWGEGRSSDSPRMSAPMRGPSRGASYSDDGGQGRAVPRGSAGSSPRGGGGGGEMSSPSGGGERTGRAVPRGEGGRTFGGNSDGARMTPDGPNEVRSAPERGAVPSYSRPREGRTPVGTAVDRGEATRPGGIPSSFYYYDPYYSYYYGSRYGGRYGNYWFPGYGYGLGFFYDPFWYDPFYGGGYGGYYGGGGYSGGGGRYYQGRGYDMGSLRLKVTPKDAKVYVDGYFVGVVDSFDGVFQKLAVEAGSHRIEVRADGYEPAQFEVMVTPGETITYKGELKRQVH